ncbi:MAG: phosphate/phosphite/phosphonate ABC transporter substrate-binding protein [Pseudomonadota bacterium]
MSISRKQRSPLLRAAMAAWLAVGISATPSATLSDETQLAALQSATDAGRTQLNFGIVPQQSASRLAKMWGPLMARLSDELDVDIRFQTTKDIPTFEACLAAGTYDIAYMNPVHYTVFAEASGYRAIARQADKKLRGLLVVRKDSGIETLDDLSGADVAFPSPGAFGASVVPRAEMRARGIAFNPNYVKSHDSVYRAVAAGLMPAGGGVLRTFNAVSPEIREQLRVLYRTEGYTPHAFALRSDLGEGLSSELQRVLLEIGQNAPELATAIGMQGFEQGADADWDDIRALDLTTRDTGIETAGSLPCPSG